MSFGAGTSRCRFRLLSRQVVQALLPGHQLDEGQSGAQGEPTKNTSRGYEDHRVAACFNGAVAIERWRALDVLRRSRRIKSQSGETDLAWDV